MSPDTSKEAYREIVEQGKDVSLRKRVAAELSQESLTLHELAEAIPDHSQNAIRPRVNELLRMECVEREGKRTNPSGHEAYVNHLTEYGEKYLRGEIDPEPAPPISKRKQKVVEMARKHARGEVDKDMLQLALDLHDQAKRKADPDWEPP